MSACDTTCDEQTLYDIAVSHASGELQVREYVDTPGRLLPLCALSVGKLCLVVKDVDAPRMMLCTQGPLKHAILMEESPALVLVADRAHDMQVLNAALNEARPARARAGAVERAVHEASTSVRLQASSALLRKAAFRRLHRLRASMRGPALARGRPPLAPTAERRLAHLACVLKMTRRDEPDEDEEPESEDDEPEDEADEEDPGDDASEEADSDEFSSSDESSVSEDEVSEKEEY